MSKHLGSAKVQIEACRALMSLGFFRPCQDIVQEVGGIEQIFETMAALRQVSDVQVEALKALCMLALNHGENKTRIIRGIDHILLSMKSHWYLYEEFSACLFRRSLSHIMTIPI